MSSFGHGLTLSPYIDPLCYSVAEHVGALFRLATTAGLFYGEEENCEHIEASTHLNGSKLRQWSQRSFECGRGFEHSPGIAVRAVKKPDRPNPNPCHPIPNPYHLDFELDRDCKFLHPNMGWIGIHEEAMAPLPMSSVRPSYVLRPTLLCPPSDPPLHCLRPSYLVVPYLPRVPAQPLVPY